MRVLISTFGPDDADLVVQAMRALPYDQLVLVGEPGFGGSKGFQTIQRLEAMSGHEIAAEELDGDDFLGLVDSVSEVLERHAQRAKNTIILNISGGTKLIGDAAILAAFRLGVETYHCDSRVVRLPVLKGATAKDRFTGHQLQMVRNLGEDALTLDDLISRMKPASKQAAERVLRELRSQGLLQTDVKPGKVLISLSRTGVEVLRALRATERRA